MPALAHSVSTKSIAAIFSGFFSPTALFNAGEVGVWYDPSDRTTLFQDSAGTTPVTAVEQPVGLILDKSRGATRTEMLTNGTFATDISGWTTQNATAAVSSGQVTLTNTGANGGIYQAITTVVGRQYFVSIQLVGVTGGGNVLFFIKSDSTNWSTPNRINMVNGSSTIQTYTSTFTATATTSYIHIINGNVTVGHSITVDNASVIDIAGNHASQATAASRPVLRQDANSKYYLAFDGVDDSLATGTITPGTDKAQVFAGVRKQSATVTQMLAELSASRATNAGSFSFLAPGSAAGTYVLLARGTIDGSNATASGYSEPHTGVVSGLIDISGATTTLRVNASQVAQGTASQGTGNFLDYPLYIGRRGGSTLPFNGQLYSMILRFSSANLDAATITKAETWVNSRTGAY